MSRVEFAAYALALVGPMGLYLYATHGPSAPQPEAMELALDDEERPSAHRSVIPFADPGDRSEPPAGLSDGKAAQGADLPFALMSDQRLILATDVPADWGTGEVRGRAGASVDGWAEDYIYGEKNANLERIDRRYRELVGKQIDLYGPVGKVCTVEVGSIAVVAEVNGDAYGYVEGDELDDEGKVGPRTGAEIRKRVYQGEERWLMADLQATAGCEGALFGRGSALPAPAMLVAQKGTVAASVKQRFLETLSEELEPSYRGFLSEGGADDEERTWPAWEQFVKETYVRRVYVDGAGEKKRVYQMVGDTESTCGWGFGEYRASVDALDGTTDGFTEVGFMAPPAAFVDVDDDGRYEVLTGGYDTALYEDDGTWVMSAERPFNGCPC